MAGEGATTQGDLAEKESTTAWCSTQCGGSQRNFCFCSKPKAGGGKNLQLKLPNFGWDFPFFSNLANSFISFFDFCIELQAFEEHPSFFVVSTLPTKKDWNKPSESNFSVFFPMFTMDTFGSFDLLTKARAQDAEHLAEETLNQVGVKGDCCGLGSRNTTHPGDAIVTN